MHSNFERKQSRGISEWIYKIILGEICTSIIYLWGRAGNARGAPRRRSTHLHVGLGDPVVVGSN